MSTDGRWFFASVVGMGEVAFVADVVQDSQSKVKASRLTLVRSDGKQVSVSRSPAYGMSLISDPVTLTPGLLSFVCVAHPKLAEACERVWSDVEIAPAGALHRLGGNGAAR